MATAAVLALAAAGCGSNGDATTSITVFASSSLIKAFTDIGKRFKSANPGASVEFIFASSSDLAGQLTDGASADVFAPGDLAAMATVVRAGLVAQAPTNFASNRLAIAVAPGDPQKIVSFADLNRPGLRVAVCAPPGACASDLQRIEDKSGIQLHPESSDSTTRDVLRNVVTGKADAGLIYTTDAVHAGDNISWFNFPESADAAATYSIAMLKNSDQAPLAARFIDLVTGHTGRQILREAGFAQA